MAYNISGSIEPLYTIPTAAKLLGIPTVTLRRALNAGQIPVHRPFSSRIRVRISEIVAAIEDQGEG